MSVVVLAEGAPLVDTLDEAATAARALGTELVVLTTGAASVAGARTFTIAGLAHFSADAWVETFAALLPALDARLVLVADDAHARAYFPRLAARLGKPLLSCATRARVRGEHIEIERPLHGGLQTERLLVELPLFVTLQSSSRVAVRPGTASAEPASAKAGAGRDVVARVVPPNAETVDIRSAERIVAGGLGLGSKDAVALLGRLAKRLDAAVGGTRVISDRGWLEHDRYIGSTGKIVAPKLYIALGISGASQHLVGMTDSEAVIAINTDRAAPIFGVADLGIVGDLHAIIPELEQRLAKEDQ